MTSWLGKLLGGAKSQKEFYKGATAYKQRDYRMALDVWRPLAEQGLVEAQLNLGIIYGNGKGVSQDYVEAYGWLTRAAGQGNEEARKIRDKVVKRMSEVQLLEAKVALFPARVKDGGDTLDREYGSRQKLVNLISKGANLITESKVSEREKIEKGIQLLEALPDNALHDEDAALKYVHLGIAHRKMKDWGSSSRCFRKAIEHGHSTGFAYEKLAINLTKQGKLEEAIDVCKSLIDHPTIPKPRSYLTREMMQKRMEKLQKKLAAEKPKGA